MSWRGLLRRYLRPTGLLVVLVAVYVPLMHAAAFPNGLFQRV